MKNLNPEVEKIIIERFGKDSVIALATMENGLPHVRYVNGYYEDGAFYVITHALSAKMQQIEKNPNVAIAGEWFTAHGTGSSLGYFGKAENAAMAEKLRLVFAEWIDNGHTDFSDINTCILCITLTDGVLLSHGTRYDVDFRSILYHGSPVGGLTELAPFLSEHGKPYLYFADNPLVALLYAVKPVPKPFSFYPYGFAKDGAVVYSEYYENAFADIYKGKRGYLYACRDVQGTEQPTQINCAYTCTEPVKVDTVSEIPDLYAFFKEQEKAGRFRVKSRQEISEKEIGMAVSALREDMQQYNLKEQPEHAMSIFLQSHFPGVWEEKSL